MSGFKIPIVIAVNHFQNSIFKTVISNAMAAYNLDLDAQWHLQFYYLSSALDLVVFLPRILQNRLFCLMSKKSIKYVFCTDE